VLRPCRLWQAFQHVLPDGAPRPQATGQLYGLTVVWYDDREVDVIHMARSKRIPQVGDPVTVVFLGARLGGVVTLVGDSGRRLTVWTDDGEALSFVLSRATGNFHKDGQQSAARLVFEHV
jgi:hypothetical protein